MMHTPIPFRKGKQNLPQKRFQSHYVQDCHKVIDDWEGTFFEKCQTHKELKKGKRSGNTN